jgi:hypothetical protein
MIVGKLTDKKQIVEILRFERTVQFSDQQGWLMINTDFDRPNHLRQGFQWIPSNTRFDWVRSFTL